MVLTSQLHAHTTQSEQSDIFRVKLDEIKVQAAHSSITIGQAPLSVSYLNRSDADMTARPAATLNELTFTLPVVWVSIRENQKQFQFCRQYSLHFFRIHI